jgi:hypothetical protein
LRYDEKRHRQGALLRTEQEGQNPGRANQVTNENRYEHLFHTHLCTYDFNKISSAEQTSQVGIMAYRSLLLTPMAPIPIVICFLIILFWGRHFGVQVTVIHV